MIGVVGLMALYVVTAGPTTFDYLWRKRWFRLAYYVDLLVVSPAIFLIFLLHIWARMTLKKWFFLISGLYLYIALLSWASVR